uniref:Transmembrane protein 177 n=1 Tax=Caenorhabditis japonica TaxID=281687 RepID=A0A8R1I559_CAEJA
MGSTYAEWNQKATQWLQSKMGRRARIGLLAATVVGYPIGSILINGPFVNLTFPRRYSIADLPPHLVPIADQEYGRFLERENRVPKDAVVSVHIQKTLATSSDETVASGSLGVRTGLRLAVPLYARFRNSEEALEYFRSQNEDGVEFLGEKVPVQWESETAKELADCYALSNNAYRFIFLRDLYAYDGYASLAQRSISWATWTTFSSIFTYWIHNSSRMMSGSAASFAVVYPILLGAAWYANKQWHLLYRYLTDIHADAEAARASFEHAEGGKEYYWKMLKRNRLMRDLKPSLWNQVTATGDIRAIATPIITRYDHLKDVNEEDDELKTVVSMDD